MSDRHEGVCEECQSCKDEDYYESEESDDQIVCGSCGEWTSVVRCKGCRDIVFDSACCG